MDKAALAARRNLMSSNRLCKRLANGFAKRSIERHIEKLTRAESAPLAALIRRYAILVTTLAQTESVLENQIVNDNRPFGRNALLAGRDYIYRGQLLQHIFVI